MTIDTYVKIMRFLIIFSIPIKLYFLSNKFNDKSDSETESIFNECFNIAMQTVFIVFLLKR